MRYRSSYKPRRSFSNTWRSRHCSSGLGRKKGCCGPRPTLSVVEILEEAGVLASDIKVRASERASERNNKGETILLRLNAVRGSPRLDFASSRFAWARQARPSQAEPSQAKPSQARPSQAKPSQAEPSRGGLALISRDTTEVNGPGHPRT